MKYETTIPAGNIDEVELTDLVKRLAKIAGASFEIDRQIMISTDDSFLLSMVLAFADTVRNGTVEVIQAPERSNGHKKRKVKKAEATTKKEPSRGPHVRSIQVNGSGEMISRFELNRRLRERTIEPGVTLRSPKYGVLTVALSGDSLVVMNAEEEVV